MGNGISGSTRVQILLLPCLIRLLARQGMLKRNSSLGHDTHDDAMVIDLE